jgi:hypothetical protein
MLNSAFCYMKSCMSEKFLSLEGASVRQLFFAGAPPYRVKSQNTENTGLRNGQPWRNSRTNISPASLGRWEVSECPSISKLVVHR